MRVCAVCVHYVEDELSFGRIEYVNMCVARCSATKWKMVVRPAWDVFKEFKWHFGTARSDAYKMAQRVVHLPGSEAKACIRFTIFFPASFSFFYTHILSIFAARQLLGNSVSILIIFTIFNVCVFLHSLARQPIQVYIHHQTENLFYKP